MSILATLNKFLKFDRAKPATPDMEWEVQEELNRLKKTAEQKEYIGRYISHRKERLMRDIANASDDPKANDAVIRAMAGRIRELMKWEQDINFAVQQHEAISTWWTEWKEKAKAAFSKK